MNFLKYVIPWDMQKKQTQSPKYFPLDPRSLSTSQAVNIPGG